MEGNCNVETDLLFINFVCNFLVKIIGSVTCPSLLVHCPRNSNSHIKSLLTFRSKSYLCSIKVTSTPGCKGVYLESGMK